MSERRSAASHLAHQVGSRLQRDCDVRGPARLLVAVSGGADSVALLRLLVELAPRRGLQLEIGHFDHGLRPDSGADAAFVGELAAQHGLPVHLGRWTAPRPGEAAARRARYEFLEDQAAALGCEALALAHHLDDQIETVLLRLSRGSGVRGALGMAWRRPGPVPIVRPLLAVRGAELRAYLETLGQVWREDPTNRDGRAARNRVRQLVLPALDAALEPGWASRWSGALADQRAAWDWLATEADGLLEAASVPGSASGEPPACRVAPLRAAPAALVPVALQRWIEPRLPRDLSRRHLQAATALVRNGQSGQSVQLPEGLRLVLEQGRLVLLAEAPPAAAPGAWTLLREAVPGPAAWAEIERQPTGRAPADRLPARPEAWVAADAVVEPLAVRAARRGDRVQLLSAPGSKTVRRILQDRRVPWRLRAGWPVVADGRGIVWLPGLGVAERMRLESRTARALRLRLERVAAAPATLAPADPAP
jgi:tRNA(Ile)-lysidine synthase